MLIQLASEPSGTLPLHQLTASLVVANALSRSGITRLLDRMDRDGLVRRTVGKHDRRRFDVSLTPEGQRRFEQVWPGHAEGIRRYFAEPLTQHHIGELGNIMAHLIKANENQPSKTSRANSTPAHHGRHASSPVTPRRTTGGGSAVRRVPGTGTFRNVRGQWPHRGASHCRLAWRTVTWILTSQQCAACTADYQRLHRCLRHAGTAPDRRPCLDPHDCVISKLAAGRENYPSCAAALVS